MDGTRSNLITKLNELRLMSPRSELDTILAARRTPATITTYRRSLLRFILWAQSHDRLEFPVSAQTVVEYLMSMHRDGLARSTFSIAITALRLLHSGYADPTRDTLVKEVLIGIRRLDRRPTKKAHPVSIAELEAMCLSLAAVGDGRSLRDRALITVGWCAAMRPSEIVALDWKDVANAERGIEINIRESKTCKDPNGELVALPLLSADHVEICPVRALRAIQTANSEGPIFITSKKPLHRLGHRAVERIILRASNLARLSIPVSGHSLRRGFATFAAYNGITERALMRHGRWKTAAIMAGYVERGRIWTENPVAELLG
jgi:site-specific recombinase XerD